MVTEAPVSAPRTVPPPAYWVPQVQHPATPLVPGDALPPLERTWAVFLLPHSHTDVGYTHPQPECLERHSANLDAAVLFAEQTRDWPDGTRFRWNVEVSLQLEHFAHTRPARQMDRLLAAIREGSIGVEALWANVLTGLCSTEELCRLTAPAADWRRRYGLPVDTAMMTDVAGYVWNLPQVLARSGVRFLSVAPNNHRAPIFTLGELPPLFYWEGPDGSRVLTWVNDIYNYARAYGFAPVIPGNTQGFAESTDEAVERAARKLYAVLAHLEKTAYPYDAIILRASLGDNREASVQVAETVRAFNQRYPNPAVRLALSREVANYAEAAIAGGRWPAPPILRGDWTGYWEDGAISSAVETALGRSVQRRLFAAEARHALATLRDPLHPYPERTGGHALRSLWLFDEHTWGANVSVRDPDSIQSRLQWQYKSDYLHTAATLTDSLDASASPSGARVESGRTTPAGTWDGRTAENSRFRVQFDEHGDVAHVFDKVLGRDLVDSSSPYRLNQFWYEQPLVAPLNTPLGPKRVPWEWLGLLAGHPMHRSLPEKQARHTPAAIGTPCVTSIGPDSVEVRVERQAPGCARLVQRVRLDGASSVEFVNEVDKLDVRDKEAAYFAFPFAAGRPDFRLEVGGVPLVPERDQLSGACRDWYAVQRYAAVTGTAGVGTVAAGSNSRDDDEHTILLAPLDAPLVCIGGMTPDLWRAHHPQPWPNGTLFSWVLHNYWDRNYKASQSGRLVFRYRLGAHTGPFDAARALAWLASWPEGQDTIPSAPWTLSAALGGAIRVEPAHVELVALKRAEDGERFVVRLVETAGRQSQVTLRLPVPAGGAWRAALTEELSAPLVVHDGTVTLTLGAHEIATVLFSPAERTPPA